MKREERKHKEQTLLHDLIMNGGLKPDILETWRRETRRRKSAFYDRLGELSEEDRVRYESLPDRRMLDRKKLEELKINIEDDYELYEHSMNKYPELSRQPTKNSICAWWCKTFPETASSFEMYWAALPQEIRDLVKN
jgi:hypothetical protein